MLEKAEKPAHRIITKNQFTALETMDEVIESLIGESRLAARPSLGLELGREIVKYPISV
jgi:hypothetical protein